MLNFGSAQVGGGGGPQYWEEVSQPLFNGNILLENNNVNGVVARANNTPVNYDNLVTSWYDTVNDKSINIIGTIDISSGNFLSGILTEHDYIQGNSNINIINTGLIVGGTYTGNNYEAAFWSFDQGIYFNYIDINRGLSMACVIYNDMNNGDMGWSIQSTKFNGYVFGIDEDGKICTNQVVANTPHSSPTGELPIYDNSGTYLGKILVY